MGDHDDLIERFAPALRYDSNEQFFADDASQFTDAPGIELRRVASAGRPGRVIASADTEAKEPKLTLAFLDPDTYVTGVKVEKTDVISMRGKDYRSRYVRLRKERPDLNNRLYGRAVEVNGRLWLQYWAWYFYNDYQLALGFGTHEGDWESIQLRIGIDGDAPDVAVYAQHRNGERRAWEDVEKLDGSPDTPVVYVARGSHAAYFEAGYHQTDAWYDLADGKRPAPKLALEIIDEEGEHQWMRWPGRWGDTTPGDRGDALDQSSPTGPGTKRHWRSPDTLLDNARPSILRTAPRAPDVRITRTKGARMQIDYDFAARTVQPRALVVTVNSRDEHGVPPMTTTYEEVASAPGGTIKTDVELHPARNYDIYASTVSGDPPQPSASKLTEIDPVATASAEEAIGPKLAQGLGKLFAKIRGDD
ncbi:MAG: hypothetical protein QOE11_3341 [Solirubrobacteraceae bacterium]|nr:hypothetical protein [Solirubrobacteraceae bacterium]